MEGSHSYWKVQDKLVRTSLLPYERNNSSKAINIPLYMLFVLDKELKAELSNVV